MHIHVVHGIIAYLPILRRWVRAPSRYPHRPQRKTRLGNAARKSSGIAEVIGLPFGGFNLPTHPALPPPEHLKKGCGARVSALFQVGMLSESPFRKMAVTTCPAWPSRGPVSDCFKSYPSAMAGLSILRTNEPATEESTSGPGHSGRDSMATVIRIFSGPLGTTLSQTPRIE